MSVDQTVERLRKLPCRFGNKCFDNSCFSHHDTPFCIEKIYCKDFYCGNRHPKARKRPCAKGGDCPTKDKSCIFLHPTDCEKIKKMDKEPDKRFLQALSKTYKCNFSYRSENSTLKVGSNRGEKFVDDFMSALEKENMVIAYFKYERLKRLVEEIGIVKLEGFCKMFSRTLRNIYSGITLEMFELIMILQNSGGSEMPTEAQVLDIFSSIQSESFTYRDDPGNRVSGVVVVDVIKDHFNDKYFATADDKHKKITIYSFDSLDTREAQEFLFLARQYASANTIHRPKSTIQYLHLYSDEIKRLSDLGCVAIDNGNSSITVIKAFVSRMDNTKVYPMVMQEIDKIDEIQYEYVRDPDRFCTYASLAYPKIIARNVKNNICVITISKELYQDMIRTLDLTRIWEWNFEMIKINRLYGMYLRETDRFPEIPKERALYDTTAVIVGVKPSPESDVLISNIRKTLSDSEKTVVAYIESRAAHIDITKNEYVSHRKTIKKLAHIYGVHTKSAEVLRPTEIGQLNCIQKATVVSAWGVRGNPEKFVEDVRLLVDPDISEDLKPYTKIVKVVPRIEWDKIKAKVRDNVKNKKATMEYKHGYDNGLECITITVSGLRVNHSIFDV